MTPPNNDVLSRLDRIESILAALVEQKTVKDWYSTAELASLVKRKMFTVREWCRLGRIRAEKRRCGRGPTSEWMVSHAEVMRVRSEGLLPETPN